MSFALTLSSPSTPLFTSPPAIDKNGTLSFSLAPNQFGAARYTVALSEILNPKPKTFNPET